MANEKVNKVILGNETLIDLTGDTVTANSLLAGATAHDNRGEQIQGAVSVPEELNDLDDVDNNSPQEGDVLVSDENGVYQNKPIGEATGLASINTTGATNTTGSTINAGTYFYLDGVLVRAKANIANGASYTLNTNYEVVTAGALNEDWTVYTTQKVAVGIWLDGKTIYRKAYSIPVSAMTTTASYQKTYDHGLSIDTLVSFRSSFKVNNTNQGIVNPTVPYTDNAIAYTAGASVNISPTFFSLNMGTLAQSRITDLICIVDFTETP